MSDVRRGERKTGLTAADDAHLTLAGSEYFARQLLAAAVLTDEVREVRK